MIRKQDMEIEWLGHAGFRLQVQGLVIYIDPYNISRSLHDADFVLSTHSHYDHFSPDDIMKVSHRKTQWIVSSDAVSQARQFSDNVIGFQPDKRAVIKGLYIKTAAAYNINKPFHKKENFWVGYIIHTDTSPIFFHTGDSDNIPEYSRLDRVDILAVPCSGTYTMNAEEAAEAAAVIKPKTVIPMHWGSVVGRREDAVKVQKLLADTDIEVIIPGQ